MKSFTFGPLDGVRRVILFFELPVELRSLQASDGEGFAEVIGAFDGTPTEWGDERGRVMCEWEVPVGTTAMRVQYEGDGNVVSVYLGRKAP